MTKPLIYPLLLLVVAINSFFYFFFVRFVSVTKFKYFQEFLYNTKNKNEKGIKQGHRTNELIIVQEEMRGLGFLYCYFFSSFLQN